MPATPQEQSKKPWIILSPQHAKRFLKAPEDNIQRFEETHGIIKDQESVEFPLNFGSLPRRQAKLRSNPSSAKL